MKIAMLLACASRNAGGVYEAVRNLASSMTDQTQTQVEIIGAVDEFTSIDADAGAGVVFRTYGISGPRAFGFSPRLLPILRSARPDLVHAHGLWMYTSLASHLWSKSTGAPHVVSPHGMLEQWAVRKSRCKKTVAAALYERRHLAGASAVHALTEAEARDIRAFGIRSPICIVPNGVDLDVEATHIAPTWASGSHRTMLFLGRLHPKKGLANLLTAWGNAKAAMAAAGWQLVIAGWDQDGHRARLETLVGELDLGDFVRFVGPLHGREKVAAMWYADLFVLPSLSEGLPMAVLEAWACSTPALITPECNLPEGVTSGAALVTASDPPSLTRMLNEMAGCPESTLRDMGNRGRSLVEQRYSRHRIATRMQSIYDWILGGGTPPDQVWLH